MAVFKSLIGNDITQTTSVLNQLVDKGNTIIIIEHNLDVIKQVDYIIDIGPEGGKKGGTLIDKGSPEEIIKRYKSLSHIEGLISL